MNIQQLVTLTSAAIAIVIIMAIIVFKVQPGGKHSEWMAVALILACVSVAASLGASA